MTMHKSKWDNFECWKKNFYVKSKKLGEVKVILY